MKKCPELGPFVARNDFGDLSLDFTDPAGVKALNRALLLAFYGIQGWDIPPNYLCPPIPGRADYVHHLADLLASTNGGAVPRGPATRILDIGVGANAIYPLLGHREYGWRFVGSDIDAGALESARRILKANEGLPEAIELRLQTKPGRIFQGILQGEETFAACLCNPPFHASARAAQEGTERKWQQLGKPTGAHRPTLNFGGQSRELWCEGGEAAFIQRMIEGSAEIPHRIRWFTALVSKSANLPAIRRALAKIRVRESRIIPMAQGQKQSRIVAWTYLEAEQR